LELSNYFFNELNTNAKNTFNKSNFNNSNNSIFNPQANTNPKNTPDEKINELKELEKLINEFYSLSLLANDEYSKTKTNNCFSKISSSNNNFNNTNNINNGINNQNHKYMEFPSSINHKNFLLFSTRERENNAVFELTINRIKEFSESLGLFYLDLQRLHKTFLQKPKEAFENFNILKTYKASNDDITKTQIADLAYLFKDNRYKFRRNLKYFLSNQFSSESKQLVFFIDNLVFAFNDFEFIRKLVEDFLRYIEDYYDIELQTLNVNRKLRKVESKESILK